MSDSGYAYDAAKKLVDMALVLFSKGDIGLRVTERELTLDAEELEEISSSNTQ